MVVLFLGLAVAGGCLAGSGTPLGANIAKPVKPAARAIVHLARREYAPAGESFAEAIAERPAFTGGAGPRPTTRGCGCSDRRSVIGI